jgi:hypothetical protein
MPNGHLPSKDFWWPDEVHTSGTPTTVMTYRPCPTVDDLRRDRDELLAALERDHKDLSAEFGGCQLEPCPVCALVARIKGPHANG